MRGEKSQRMVIGIENNKQQEKWREVYEQRRNRTFLGIQLIFTYLTGINTQVAGY